MKRSRKVTIIVDALVGNGLIDGSKIDRARFVVKEALKSIGGEVYEENRRRKKMQRRGR